MTHFHPCRRQTRDTGEVFRDTYITENKRKSTSFSHVFAWKTFPVSRPKQLFFSAFIWEILSNWCSPICYKNRFLLTRAVFLPPPSLLLSLPMQIFIEVLLRSQKTKVSFPRSPLPRENPLAHLPFPFPYSGRTNVSPHICGFTDYLFLLLKGSLASVVDYFSRHKKSPKIWKLRKIQGFFTISW